jgi:rubrerythrin
MREVYTVRKVTEENLRMAFAGKSQAHMRYQIFADKAEKDNYPNIARLFRAIAYAERVHATNHFKALGDLDGSADNLEAAIGGETFEVQEMYPAYDAVAKLQGEREAERSVNFALEAEKSTLLCIPRQKKRLGLEKTWRFPRFRYAMSVAIPQRVTRLNVVPFVAPLPSNSHHSDYYL